MPEPGAKWLTARGERSPQRVRQATGHDAPTARPWPR
jgi:hypothetical protein